jgi:hypothetical protein
VRIGAAGVTYLTDEEIESAEEAGEG